MTPSAWVFASPVTRPKPSSTLPPRFLVVPTDLHSSECPRWNGPHPFNPRTRNLVQGESNQEALRWLSSRGGTEVGEVMNNPNQQNPGQQQGGQDKPGQQQGGGGQQKPGQQQQEPGKGGQQGGQGGQRQGSQE